MRGQVDSRPALNCRCHYTADYSQPFCPSRPFPFPRPQRSWFGVASALPLWSPLCLMLFGPSYLLSSLHQNLTAVTPVFPVLRLGHNLFREYQKSLFSWKAVFCLFACLFFIIYRLGGHQQRIHFKEGSTDWGLRAAFMERWHSAVARECTLELDYLGSVSSFAIYWWDNLKHINPLVPQCPHLKDGVTYSIYLYGCCENWMS